MDFRKIILILILIHHPLGAVNLQINESLTIRVGQSADGESNYTGKAVGILPKGSIVDIPDEYILRDESGKVNIDFTLNKWFEEGGKYFRVRDGINIFHTPIKVVHPQLDPVLADKDIHIALQNVKLKEDSSTVMNVIEDSEFLSVVENMETEAGSTCIGACSLSDEVLDENTKDFISEMENLQNSVLAVRVRNAALGKANTLSNSAKYLDRNLQNHCGISQKDMAVEIKKMIELKNLPFECNELMGLLLMESSGRCRALNTSNSDSSTDVGLFQINSDNFKADLQSGRVKQCTDAEFKTLLEEAKKSENAVAFWKAQPKPQCIANPMYSLKKGMKVLSDNAVYFRRYREDHPDLYRRFILSGYNGGQLNVTRALRDLATFNRDLQKRLSEGGKDITRSNRGIRKIKEEIGIIESGFQLVNESLNSLNPRISQAEDAIQKMREQYLGQETLAHETAVSKRNKEKELTRILDETRQKIDQRRQDTVSKISEDVELEVNQIKPLVHEWNTLNEQEMSAVAQQQEILSYLDQHFQNVTNQQRDVDPFSEEGRILNVHSQALERLISEIEEDSWPYYIEQLSELPSRTRRKKPTTDKDEEDGATNIFTQFADTHRQKLNNVAEILYNTIKGSDKEPSWDFYQINSLEKKLEEKHNLIRERGPQRQDSVLMQEAMEIQRQLSTAREQRRKDIGNILDRNYRRNMSLEERTRALKIVESEIEMMKMNANKELSQQFDDLINLRSFFTPLPMADTIFQLGKLQDAQEELIEGQDEALVFLSRVMNRRQNNLRSNPTYLSVVQKWEDDKAEIDKKRKDLEENDLFTEVKPFLSQRTNSNGINILTVGPRTRSFYEGQVRTKYDKQTIDQEIRDVSKMSIDSNLTLSEIELLRQNIQQMEANLSDLRSNKVKLEDQKKFLIADQVEKLDQKDILQEQMKQAQRDLTTSQKDPHNWEDIKLFFFASELKKGIDDSGLIGTRSRDNAIRNSSYVDGLLGAENLSGFMQKEQSKNLCPLAE